MLNSTMKAAILVELKKPLVIADVTLPETLDYGQVLVKIHYSGVCGSQLGEIDGVKGPDRFLPHLLGHEAGGIVVDCGPGVTQLTAGNAVVLHWRKGTGIESPMPNYLWNGKAVNAGRITTFSEYAIISENRLTAIAEDFDLKIAALYGCALTTGIGAVCNDANLKPGESIAIIGAGGVGLAAIMGARMSSAYPIIAIDIQANKLVAAKHHGATHTINSSTEDVSTTINNILLEAPKQTGLDVAIDTTGIRALRELAYELTDMQGRTILVGVPTNSLEKMSIDSLPLHFNKSITGSEGGGIQPDYHIPRLIRLQKAGIFNPSQMISHTFKLEEINEAIAAMRGGKVLKCCIKMN